MDRFKIKQAIANLLSVKPNANLKKENGCFKH